MQCHWQHHTLHCSIRWTYPRTHPFNAVRADIKAEDSLCSRSILICVNKTHCSILHIPMHAPVQHNLRLRQAMSEDLYPFLPSRVFRSLTHLWWSASPLQIVLETRMPRFKVLLSWQDCTGFTHSADLTPRIVIREQDSRNGTKNWNTTLENSGGCGTSSQNPSLNGWDSCLNFQHHFSQSVTCVLFPQAFH